MPSHAENKVLPFSPEQMFDLVASVETYPEFLPWCVATRIKSQTETLMIADMVVGFGPLRETYTSRVSLDRPGAIHIEDAMGPFTHLTTDWHFLPHEDGCVLDFKIDFAFRSKMLEMTMGKVFDQAIHKIMGAFETRAAELYA